MTASKMKAALIIGGFLSATFLAASPSVAAPQVTGISGCIMSNGGNAGNGTNFYQCGSGPNWIYGNFVNADAVNTAFTQLERDIINKLNSLTVGIKMLDPAIKDNSGTSSAPKSCFDSAGAMILNKQGQPVCTAGQRASFSGTIRTEDQINQGPKNNIYSGIDAVKIKNYLGYTD